MLSFRASRRASLREPPFFVWFVPCRLFWGMPFRGFPGGPFRFPLGSAPGTLVLFAPIAAKRDLIVKPDFLVRNKCGLYVRRRLTGMTKFIAIRQSMIGFVMNLGGTRQKMMWVV